MPAKIKSLWQINLVSISVFIMAGVVAGLLLLRSFAAGSANLYITPATTTVDVNNNVTMNVMLDTAGGQVDAAQIFISYDPGKLQYVSADFNGTSLNDFPQTPTVGSGEVSFIKISFTPQSGNLLLAKLTFKAIAGSGSTQLAHTASSEAAYQGNSVIGARNGATINLNTPSTTPPPSDGEDGQNPPPSTTPPTSSGGNQNSGSSSGQKPSSGSGGSSTSPASGGNSTPPAVIESTNPEGPSISDIQVTNIGFKKASIKLNTSKPTTVSVEYGESQSLGSIAESKEAKQEHVVALDNPPLSPGITYSYKLTATDTAGNQTSSDIYEFTTRGYFIIIKLSKPGGEPLAQVPVQLFSQPREGTTDDSGQVEFDNVALGEHTVKYSHEGQNYEQKLEVNDTLSLESSDVEIADDTEVNPQVFQLFAEQSTGSSSSRATYLATIAVVLILAMVGFGVVLYVKNRKLHPQPISAGIGEVSVGGVGFKPTTIDPQNNQSSSNDKSSTTTVDSNFDNEPSKEINNISNNEPVTKQEEDDPIKKLLDSDDKNSGISL